ncbi:unnamed protein product [Urochloa humidicola]
MEDDVVEAPPFPLPQPARIVLVPSIPCNNRDVQGTHSRKSPSTPPRTIAGSSSAVRLKAAKGTTILAVAEQAAGE